MQDKLFRFIILTILALAIFAPHTYAYNTQSDCSNTNWYFITYNTYLFCQSGQTLYADSISNMGTYANFTNAAFNSNQNPSHSFSVRTIGGNTTINQINQDNVILQTTSTSTNMSFYYNAYQNVFSEADIGNTPFYPSDYLTSYATWSSTSGPSIYWNQTGNYLEVKGGTSYTFWYSLVDVTLILNHANAGSLLVQPDYLLVNYTKNAVAQTFHAVDGSNTFSVDPFSTITVNGIDAQASSTFRQCLTSCDSYSFNVNVAGSATKALQYTTQYSVTASYSISSGTPISTESPYFDSISFGFSHRNQLTQSGIAYWLDNGSAITPQNPWFSNIQLWIPSPTSATVTSSESIDFAYSINGVAPSGHGTAPGCSTYGTNASALMQNGCYAPGVFYSFANVLTPPVTWAMLVAMIAIPTQISGKNLLLTFMVVVFMVGFIGFATSSMAPIFTRAMFLVGAAGVTGILVKMAKRGPD